QDAAPVTLEGQECLVFFLGGIPANGQVGCTGFSSIPNSPSTPGGSRSGPYFNFDTGRLKRTKGVFMAYHDPFGTNFCAYFDAGSRDNGYPRNATLPLGGSPTVPTSDCMSLGVWPYFSGNGVYHNPKSFQIICAGKDGVFGPGNVVFGQGTPVDP